MYLVFTKWLQKKVIGKVKNDESGGYIQFESEDILRLQALEGFSYLYSWKEWPKPRVTFSKAEKADKGAVYEEGVSEDYSYRDRKFLCTKEQYYEEICYYFDIYEVLRKNYIHAKEM